MEWNTEISQALLEKVRPQEVLWDVKHPDFPKKTLKRATWDTVCRELRAEHPEATTHLTTDGVMARFTYLRGNFQKLLRVVERTPSGSGGEATPKWEFFSACSFLRPVYANSKSEPSITSPVLTPSDTTSTSMLTSSPTLFYVSPPVPSPSPSCSSDSVSVSSPSSPTLSPTVVGFKSGPPRAKRSRYSDFKHVHNMVMDSLTELETVLKEVGDKKKETHSNPEELLAERSVKALMASIPDSHRHLRIEFNTILLNLIAQMYEKYKSETSTE
ncbi:uncharacterized protein LOC127005504 [Eriocheir sinensis]|uniref:uncharacterized protein LOC127005504 n=1 Tax=Eriocheir sinensis TaxID=95602 RepID=UPI0021CAB602|nr:uncharacterized protein LOC127005504 [Eriocheir sinensis]